LDAAGQGTMQEFVIVIGELMHKGSSGLTNLFRAADLKKEFENLAKQNAGH
jgi:hypothetical protein